MRVHGDLIFCGVTDKTLIFGERNIGWSGAVSLVVCNDFNTIILPHTHATERIEMSRLKGITKWGDAHE